MRPYDIFSGILLLLSMTNFALPAPVSVQENGQALVNVVHRPKSVITVLGKRMEHILEAMLKNHFGPLEILDNSESSASYTLSGSSQSEHNQGLTNVWRPLSPNTASSMSNPNPLMKHSSSVPNLLAPPSWGNRIEEMPVGDSKPRPSYEVGDGSHWTENTPSSSGYESDQEFTEAHRQQPNHPLPSADSVSPTDSDLDLNHWTNSDNPPPAPELTYPKHQSSSKDSQPVDRLEDHLLAAIYAAKGKAKESRRISGSARDVGNAGQGEF
jgi:hypothetical protein